MGAAKRMRFEDEAPKKIKRSERELAELRKKRPRGGNPDFQKGMKKRGGRQKGTPNATTKLLKDAIQTAMELAGSDGRGLDGAAGYLAWMARKHPQVFGRLLERLLPYQLTGAGGGPIQAEYTSKKEILLRFQERGLPLPSLLEPPTYQPPADLDEAEYEEIEAGAEDIDRIDGEE